MSGTFDLEIMTPQRQFYRGSIEALSVTTVDGEMTFLRNHAPISVPLTIGSIKIKHHGQWKVAFQSEGFVEIKDNLARVFVQSCEWPEDIDPARALAAEQRALERLQNSKNLSEYQWTQVALNRALTRLRIIGNKGKNYWR